MAHVYSAMVSQVKDGPSIPMSRVRLESVVKVFSRSVEALRSVSIDVPEGQLLALVGPSGCGKTTTLRLIAGLEQPTSGTVSIEASPREPGSPSRDFRHSRPAVAMVFQGYALYPHMSVERNLGFASRLAGEAADNVRARMRSAAESLGISGLLTRRPGELSGGERQRVALCRAMMTSPSVLLLDEPLASLDPRTRALARAELKTFHARTGVTTVCVTHDQEDAMALGDRVAVMRAGRVEQVGTAAEVYERPCNRFVAGFIGTPAMNFVAGSLEHTPSGARFIAAGSRPEESLTLGIDLARRVADATGRSVLLGLRPESLTLGNEGDLASGAAFLPLNVEAVAFGGSWIDVSGLAWGRHRVIARLNADREARRLSRGASVRLAVRPQGVHVFSSDDAGECFSSRGAS